MKTWKFVAEVLCVIYAALLLSEAVYSIGEFRFRPIERKSLLKRFNSPSHIRPPPLVSGSHSTPS